MKGEFKLNYINRITYYHQKIFNRFASELINIVRLSSVYLRFNRIETTGYIRLAEGVKFNNVRSGVISLRGPVSFERYVTIHSDGGRVIIGENTSIGSFTMIASLKEVVIGSNCLIAESVSIRDHDHKFTNPKIPFRNQGWLLDPIRIGNNVWLGAKVTITKGCQIGDNVVVGANSVVTKNIPANSLALGSPAKVIRKI
jgi:acetyltransferase-like isoleucine patch superfamily enzyme